MQERLGAEEIIRNCGVRPDVAERLAIYADLRNAGITNPEIVKRMGIHPDTSKSYAAWWRNYFGVSTSPVRPAPYDPTSDDTRALLLDRAQVDPESGCWLWQGTLESNGYGVVRLRLEPGPQGFYRMQAHRVAYINFVGPIPEGLVLDHLCRVRRCCNPSHLEPVTHRENIVRGVSPAARNAHLTHCPDGHPLEGTNLYIKPGRGDRACLICKRIDDKERVRRRSGLPPFTLAERIALAAMPLAPVRRRRRLTVSTPTPIDPTVDLEEMRRRPPGERTHCRMGHPYEGANLIVLRDGSRQCRECKNANQRSRNRQAK